MGIFEFSRPENYSIISEEWQIFESVFRIRERLNIYPKRERLIWTIILTGY